MGHFPHKPYRHRLPDERAGLTHKFNVAGHEGYLTIGLYPNGIPGEIFIQMAKEGSAVSGLMDGVALLTSLCLQYNVPLELLVEKFKGSRFLPQGVTNNPAIANASSVLDYIFRYLELKFCQPDAADKFAAGLPLAETEPALAHAGKVISEIAVPIDPLALVEPDDPLEGAPDCVTCSGAGYDNRTGDKCDDCNGTGKRLGGADGDQEENHQKGPQEESDQEADYQKEVDARRQQAEEEGEGPQEEGSG